MKITTAEQLVVIGRLWVDKKVPVDQTQKLIDSGFLSDLCDGNLDQVKRDDFRRMLGLAPLNARPTFPVSVDYRRTLAEMISAGRYDRINSDITAEHFPIKGEGQQPVELALFHFNRVISSDDAIREMDQAGYRPAKIEELLALGVKRPDLQRQFPIIALASPWQGSGGLRCVPCLSEWYGGRALDLRWFEGGWAESCRFPAVRK